MYSVRRNEEGSVGSVRLTFVAVFAAVAARQLICREPERSALVVFYAIDIESLVAAVVPVLRCPAIIGSHFSLTPSLLSASKHPQRQLYSRDRSADSTQLNQSS